MLDNYVKAVNIEALTMIDMARKEIIPAVTKFTADTASAVAAKTGVVSVACKYEKRLITTLSDLTDEMDEDTSALEGAVAELRNIEDIIKASEFVRDNILPKMDTLRVAADKVETVTSEDYWPFPTYDKLLFGVK